MRTAGMLGVATSACLVITACGGGSTAAPAARETSTELADVTDVPPTSEPPAAIAVPDTDPPAATDPPSTEAPTTTTAPAPEVVSFDLATLPDLVALVDRAATDPTVEPLGLAQALIGFPYEIPVPDGSTLHRIDASLSRHSDEMDRFDFAYSAIAPGGTVPDIDIGLDDNGPGSLEIIEIYDPIMTALGFDRTNSTGSDPGDPGGPHSINHVFVAQTPEQTINGVASTVSPLFIWSDEDLNGGSYRDDDSLGGYRVDVDIETTPGTGIPIPLVEALLAQFPVPDGLTVTSIRVSTNQRRADSFDLDKGLSYVSVDVEWEASPAMFDDIVAFYATPTDVFTDEPTVMAGDWFFSDTVIDRAEFTDYDTTSKRLRLLFLQRYGGTLGVNPSDDGSEPLTVTLDIDLNPFDSEFELPAD